MKWLNISIIFLETLCCYIFKGFDIALKSLIHGQINLIRFVESNKFDNVFSKI